MDIFEQINSVPADEIISALNLPLADDGTSYVCPECGNGKTGGNGDGIKPRENSKGFVKWHCYKCGKDFSNVDLIMAENKIELSESAKWAKEKLKVEEATFSFKGQDKTSSPSLGHKDKNFSAVGEDKKVAAPMDEQVKEKISVREKKDYSNFYKFARKNLAEFVKSSGGKFRGLTFETLEYAKCGYAPEFGEFKTPRLIVPTNRYEGLARLTVQVDELTLSFEEKETVKKLVKQSLGGKQSPFIIKAKVPSDYPVFIVEGELDAMSIWQASGGNFTAIATKSAANYDKFLQLIWDNPNMTKTKKFVVIFDNDDAGKLNAPKLVDGLKALGFKAVSFLINDSAKVDCNDLLQRDESKLTARLLEIILAADEKFENMTIENLESESAMTNENTGVEVLADIFDELDTMSEKLKGNLLKWGFPMLDEKLPMLPGNYILGALPSLGKTTFALNVCANVCEQGAAVLYISYEPTKNQIAAKDLARYWFKKIWDNHRDNRSPELVPSAMEIMLGKYNSMFNSDEMKKVRLELKEKRKRFYFLQGRKETAQDLIRKIKSYVDAGVKFIVIDYIQLIKGTDTSKTVREQIDETIRELQIFQSENDLVILFISSFNRENYRAYACIEAFKESGGLEFTADAILALQFEFAAGEKRYDVEEFQKKKQAQPRDMELVGLKNRFGIDFVDRFAYHSKHEAFIEKGNVRDEEPFCND